MTAAVAEKTASVLSDADRQQFARDGFIAVRGLFSPGEVAEIRDTFMEQAENGPVPGLSEMRRYNRKSDGTLEEANLYDPSDPLAFYPRMMHPHKHADKIVGPVASRYLLDSRLESILAELFGEDALAAQSMFYFKPPGARGQDLHQDNFYLRVKPGTCLAAWLAIDDADEENGGMVCVPGTSDLDIACPQKADSTIFFTSDHVEPPPGTAPVPVPLRAGDVLFFNGSVIHGSYPNTSKDRFRRALIFHYVPQSSAEVSGGYRPLLTFDGREIPVEDAQGGGPCGTAVPMGLH